MRFKLILATLLFLGIGLGFAQTSTALGYCDLGGFGRSGCRGYFTNAQSSASGTVNNLIYEGLTGSGSSGAAGFKNRIHDNLYGGDSHDQMGAAMVVTAMMDRGPFSSRDGGIGSAKSVYNEWADLVDQYASSTAPGDHGVRWNVSRNPVRNSAYFGDINDDAVHTDTHGPVRVVEFYWNGGNTTFQLEIACANLVGGMTPLKKDFWVLDGTTKVNATTIDPDQLATFDHKVYVKPKSSKASYTWQVRGSYKPKGEPRSDYAAGRGGDLPGSTANNIAAGNFKPDYGTNADFKYKFPASAKDNDQYCQRIDYSDATGPGTKYGSSDAKCVTLSKKDWTLVPQSKVSATTIQVNKYATFDHRVKNNGPNTANYTWQVQGRYQSGAWSATGLPANSSSANTAKGNFRPAYSGTADNKYKFPAGAPNGARYCQRIKATNGSGPGTADKYSPEVCTYLGNPPPPVAERQVNIAPSVSGPADSEVGDNVTMTATVTVSSFPTVTEWGYTENAISLPADRVNASRTTDGEVDWKWRYVCPAAANTNYATDPAVCRETKWRAAQKDSNGNWSCQMFPNFTGSTRGSGANKECQVTPEITYSSLEYNSKCAQTGAWYGWRTSTSNPCKNYYTCPGGAAGSGWYDSAPNCNGWKCQYTGATQVNQASAPTCAKRCSAGRGAAAPVPNNDHCYIAPTFSITCTWDNGSPANTVLITSDGTKTCNTTTFTSNDIGDTTTVTITPTVSGGWSSPPPGRALAATVANWTFNIDPDSASAPVNFTGRPYVKVYGGDTRVGGGVGASESTCATNTAAQIRTFARTGTPTYTGAGTQYAAFATGVIEQFVSGQYNNNGLGLNPAPNVGSMPKALSFANNSAASTYGGNFADVNSGGTPPCMAVVDKLPSGTQNEVGPITIDGLRMTGGSSGATTVRYITGNVYISDDIVYEDAGDGWASIGDMPIFQLVVKGNIYIAPNVTQLDGFYSAIPDEGNVGGNIYTCGFSDFTVPAVAFTDCSTQLVVNGGFAAKKIYFLRDCGTTKQAAQNEAKVYSGDTDNQQCGVGNHAAEVFNYTPEQWLKGVFGKSSSKYDSISSMPPVL